MLRMNFPGRKEKRRTEAEQRQADRKRRTNAEQLARLGRNVATKERARLAKD